MILLDSIWGQAQWGGIPWGAEAAISSSPQTISPSAIASGESWPTPKITGPITVSAIASGESWSSPTMIVPSTIEPPIIPTGVVWFSPVVGSDLLSVATIPTAEVWFPPVILEEQILSPSAIPSAESWFAPTMRNNTKTLSPAAIASGESWPSPTIRGGHQFIMVATIPSAERWFPPTVTGGELQLILLIAGVDRSQFMRKAENVCTLQSQTMGRWQLTFDLYDDTASYKPVAGMTVQLIDIGRRLFAGCITEVITDRFMSTQQAVVYHVTALDKSSMFDHRIVKRQYLAADWSDYTQVILDIAATALDGEGILTTGVPASMGPLGADLAFNFPTVKAAYDQIATDSGTVYWLDDNVLFYSPLTNLPAAPFALTETSRNWSNLATKQTTTAYANKIYVVTNLNVVPQASGGQTAGYSESFTATVGQPGVDVGIGPGGALYPAGIEVSLPIGSVQSITVNGVAQTIIDFANYAGQSTTGLWVFEQGYTNVNPYFIAPGAIPSGATIVVTYTPLNPSQGTSVAQYGTALNPLDPSSHPLGTCGSGVYELAVQVQNIASQDDLNAIAAAYLARVGAVPTIVDYETDFPGLKPGQLQSVNIPNSGIPTNSLLITQVKGVYAPPDNSRVDHTGAPTGSSFHWTIEANSNLDPGNDAFNWYSRLITRTNNLLPVLQYEDASFAIFPGGSIATALAITNPYPVKRTGLAVAFLWSWATAPVDQDLVVTVTRNNSPIITAVLSQTVGANVNTTFPIPASKQLYLFVGDILNVNTSYNITGANPTPAMSVTFVLRWAM